MRYGRFDDQRREYLIDRVDTPMSWTNYIGTENLAGVFNQTAGGYLFFKSAEHHRITRFRGNAVPADRPGHYVYIKDEDTGEYWSVSWQPTAKPAECYRSRHGLSYSVYSCEYAGIYAEQTLFIPRGSDVDLWDIKIENRSGRERRLSVVSYAELSYHEIRLDNENFQSSLYCAGASYAEGVIEQALHYEDGGFQFFTASFDPDGFETDRDRFIGPWRTEANPIALKTGLSGAGASTGGNQCAALRKGLALRGGETARLCFMLGEGGREAGLRAKAAFKKPEDRDAALAALAAFWEEKLSSLRIDTPNSDMNRMINIWTAYQSEINVMFSRFASFIEVGGRTGLGFRDTSQDAMCAASSDSEKCRWRLEQLFRALVSEGYGLHLFEPEWFEGGGTKARNPTLGAIPPASSRIHSAAQACSDDALWLVPAAVEYIRETGDTAFAGKIIPYADTGLEGRPPAPPESVYDHLKRILRFSGRMVGPHGVCQGLRADWNDCLNLGGGESALVSCLHLWALDNFIELASFLGREADVKEFRAMREKTGRACREALWDGEWYLRGFTKQGRPVGTKADREGRIHLESNAWAVITGGGSGGEEARARGLAAMDSVWKYLATPYGLLLNAPAYTVPDDDVGFVTRVYPGLKENCSVFSHPNPWAWVAECVLGRGDKAMELYNRLCPSAFNDMVEVRKAEPYSTCQFITGPDHPAFGEAHHPFMTGSGGWSYYAASQYILGIRPGFKGLVIDPCIPAEWPGFQAVRRFRGAEYRITVRNPEGVCKGVRSLEVDGKAAEAAPLLKQGESCEVTVTLGK